VKVLHRNVYVATSPELAELLLKKEVGSFKKFAALARFATPVIGNGILSSEGAVHRRQRRLIAPGLNRNRIARYVEAMARHTDEAITRWKRSGRIDVIPDMTRLTMAIAAQTMFNSPAETYAQTAETAVKAAMHYIASELGRPLHVPYSWPTLRNLRMKRAIAPLDDVVYGMIRERRASGERPDDILSMLLNAQDEEDRTGMTDAQVRDEVMTLFVPGHETTSNALSWCAYLLARHPDVAERVAEEARGVLGGRPPTFDDLDALPYAKQVFLEALRLYPPAYIVGKECVTPVSLLGWPIAPGDMVVLNIYGLHHRQDFFPDPERFDPDRFEGDKEKAMPRGAFIPFADGPRVCIGGHFAVMEGHVVLAHLAQSLRIQPLTAPPIPPIARVTLRPRDQFTLRVAAR
jgi:cytochrome P450